MEIYRIVGFAICAVIGITVVKQLKPEFSLALTIGVSVVILLLVCDKLYDVVYTFYDYSELSGVDSDAISCVIKVVGIGYLADFCNNLCVDADCKSIGDKVVLAGKVSILFCALPIVNNLFGTVLGLLS